MPILCQFWEDEWKEKKERSLAATVELKTSWKAGYNSLRPIEKPILAGDWQSNNLWWHLMSWRRLEAADWSIGRVDWSVDGTARLGSHLLMINWWLCLVIVDDVVTVAEFGGRWPVAVKRVRWQCSAVQSNFGAGHGRTEMQLTNEARYRRTRFCISEWPCAALFKPEWKRSYRLVVYLHRTTVVNHHDNIAAYDFWGLIYRADSRPIESMKHITWSQHHGYPPSPAYQSVHTFAPCLPSLVHTFALNNYHTSQSCSFHKPHFLNLPLVA